MDYYNQQLVVVVYSVEVLQPRDMAPASRRHMVEADPFNYLNLLLNNFRGFLPLCH